MLISLNIFWIKTFQIWLMTLQVMLDLSVLQESWVLPSALVIGPIGLVAKCLSERGTGNIPGDGELRTHPKSICCYGVRVDGILPGIGIRWLGGRANSDGQWKHDPWGALKRCKTSIFVDVVVDLWVIKVANYSLLLIYRLWFFSNRVALMNVMPMA